MSQETDIDVWNQQDRTASAQKLRLVTPDDNNDLPEGARNST